MVNQSCLRIGIDVIGSDRLMVRVGMDGSESKILSVARIAESEMTHALQSETGAVVLSVSDESVIFKNVSLPHNSIKNREKFAQFELKHMLLEKCEEFSYNLISTDQPARLLAIVARKERLEQIRKSIFIAEGNGVEPDGFLSRSIALGQGFLKFCTNDTDRLVCLADFARERISLCFVLGKRILIPASFDRSQYDIESDLDLARIAAELKTIVNFKLNELADRGINITLAKLIICGGNLDELKKLTVASRLKVPLEEPIFSRALIENSVFELDTPLSDYLVALGLTVE